MNLIDWKPFGELDSLRCVLLIATIHFFLTATKRGEMGVWLVDIIRTQRNKSISLMESTLDWVVWFWEEICLNLENCRPCSTSTILRSRIQPKSNDSNCLNEPRISSSPLWLALYSWLCFIMSGVKILDEWRKSSKISQLNSHQTNIRFQKAKAQTSGPNFLLCLLPNIAKFNQHKRMNVTSFLRRNICRQDFKGRI